MTRKTAISSQNAFNPATSVFVAANAGAGKTSLLTKRVLSLLAHGMEPSKILCLTFTNAASAEMQARVLRELGRWVMADKESLSTSLAELLGHAPDAATMARARSLFATVLEMGEGLRIQTIHGFCGSMLRRFSLEAGVNPHFKVMDTRSTQEMLQETRLRLYTHAHSHDEELKTALMQLTSLMSENSLAEIFSGIIQNKQKFQSLFYKQGSRQAAVADLWKLAGLKEGLTVDSLIERHCNYNEATLASLRSICSLLMQGKKTDIATGTAMAQWLGQPKQRVASLGHYIGAFVTQDNLARSRIFTKDTLTDEKLVELLQKEQARALGLSEALQSLSLINRSSALLTIAEAYLSIYEQLKRTHGAIDYDDMILTSLRLLEQSGMAAWVLFKLDGGIDHVLVDESQDTSPVQWKIIAALVEEFFSGIGKSEEERSLFVVGDEKQSIYSFQGADLRAMTQMQNYFAKRIVDAGKDLAHIALTHSYRSTPEILTIVDKVFSHEAAGRGVYTQNKPEHIPTRTQVPGVVELWPLLVPKEEDTLAPTTLLARTIADTISDWVKKGCWLDSKNRAVEAGDILILVRSRTAFVDALVRGLKRRNIPVAGIDRMTLSENLAVQDLLALTQAVLLPEDDLSLACVLKSPIFNIPEETLFELAHGRGEASLWQRLSEHKNCNAAYALLTELRARADYVLPYEFYTSLLDHDGARSRFIGRMGMEYADPIDEFLSQTLIYQQNYTPSLQGFLYWFSNSESEIKRDMEQAGSSVRIMTVHGAKGLQSPIVILPDTASPPVFKDILLWHDSGIPLWPGSSKGDIEITKKLRAEEKQRMLEEYNRLLYVALTRAEDRLYICGAAGKEKLSPDSWYELVKLGMEKAAQPFEGGLRLGAAPVYKTIASIPKAIATDSKQFEFLTALPPEEPTPTRPLAPSVLDAEDKQSASPAREKPVYARGRFIHSLLQYIPSLPHEKRQEAARSMSVPYRRTLGDDLDKAIAEAFAIMDDPRYAFLFSDEARAEVPIIGNVVSGGKPITVSGQIDRLYIGKDAVWIIDFKTGVKPDSIPKSYIRQLALYRLVIQKMYPGKTIACALLWTGQSSITVLDEAALAPYI